MKNFIESALGFLVIAFATIGFVNTLIWLAGHGAKLLTCVIG